MILGLVWEVVKKKEKKKEEERDLPGSYSCQQQITNDKRETSRCLRRFVVMVKQQYQGKPGLPKQTEMD